MEQIRLFIAIELPEHVKQGLAQIQNELKTSDPHVAKWVDPNNIHLTLKFLGNVALDKINDINQALRHSVQYVSPLDIEIKGLGAFPNLNRVQIIWIGITGDLNTLGSLRECIESNIAPMGFPTEKRAFTPHLTLARLHENASSQQRQILGETIIKTKLQSTFLIRVDSISLMKSQLTRSGAIYTRLNSINLKHSDLKPSC